MGPRGAQPPQYNTLMLKMQMKYLREIPIRKGNGTIARRLSTGQLLAGKDIMTFANVEGRGPPAAGSRGQSNQQRVLLQIKKSGDAIVFDFGVIVIAQRIETQTVVLIVYLTEQFRLQAYKLHRRDLTLENRILHSLTVLFADLRHAAQPLLPVFGHHRNIITYNDKHTYQPICK